MIAAALVVVVMPQSRPATEFHPPVRLESASGIVKVEAPGFAFPSLGDIDGDGRKDLLVGQFKKGKIAIYKSLGGGKFAERQWLQAGGIDAEVPGVW